MITNQSFDGSINHCFVESVPCTLTNVKDISLKFTVRTGRDHEIFLDKVYPKYPHLRGLVNSVVDRHGHWECSIELIIKGDQINPEVSWEKENVLLSDEGVPCFQLKIHQLDDMQVPAILWMDQSGDNEWLIVAKREQNPSTYVFEVPFAETLTYNTDQLLILLLAYWPVEEENSQGLRDFLPKEAYTLFHIDYLDKSGATEIRALPNPFDTADDDAVLKYQHFWIASGVGVEQPALMIFHGLGGKIEKSLANLLKDKSTMSALHAKYGRRIFGFQHPSIVDGPGTNADRFVEFFRRPIFPEAISIFSMDLLTRSRGSIVARELLERPSPHISVPYRIQKLVMLAGPNQATPSARRENLIRTGMIWLNISKHRQAVGEIPFEGDWEDDTEIDPMLISEAVRVITQERLSGRAQKEVRGCPGLRALAPQSHYIKELNDLAVVNKTEYYAINVEFDPNCLHSLPKEKQQKLAKKIEMNFGGISTDGIVPTYGGHGEDSSQELAPVSEQFKGAFKGTFVVKRSATHHESLFLNQEIRSKIVEYLIGKHLSQENGALIT